MSIQERIKRAEDLESQGYSEEEAWTLAYHEAQER